MIRNLIEPLQQQLLQKKICPGCFRNLDMQQSRKNKINQTEQVTCECSRIFIYDKQLETYRRALASEVI